MSARRKMESCSIHLTKHRYSLRTKSKCNRIELENFCLKFPVLCDKILAQLNPQSLATCKGLSNFWYDQINESRIYWITKIHFYTEDFNQYKEDWAIFKSKTSLEILKQLATALYVFRDLGKEDWKNYNKKSLKILNLESDDQWSPLHIAAKFSIELFKGIALKFKKINPANNNGETPLHSAAKCGHLDICKFILENINENENPEDNVGLTPLHYAAMLGNLEIYKFLDQNIEHENPNEGIGTSPYYCALYLAEKEICQFIEEKYNFKTHPNALKLSFSDDATMRGQLMRISATMRRQLMRISISSQKAHEQNIMPLLTYQRPLCKVRVNMGQLLTEKCTCKQ